jgi:hypothetical protein
LGNKKAELRVGDVDDVTFGSPAISTNQRYSEQLSFTEIRCFPLPDRSGFGFILLESVLDGH